MSIKYPYKVMKCQQGPKWEQFEVQSLELSSIWQSVPVALELKGKPFFENVKRSIEQNGMKFPLIIVETDYRFLKNQHSIYRDQMNPLPPDKKSGTIRATWGGSNRYAALIELGYQYADCIVLKGGQEVFNQAQRLQRIQRQPFVGELH